MHETSVTFRHDFESRRVKRGPYHSEKKVIATKTRYLYRGTSPVAWERCRSMGGGWIHQPRERERVATLFYRTLISDIKNWREDADISLFFFCRVRYFCAA